MFRTFLRFLRPMAYLRRKAILGGVFGGQRKWLVWGGLAWVFHWMGRLVGVSEPVPKYTAELKKGERAVVVHEPESPLAVRKRERKERRRARRVA